MISPKDPAAKIARAEQANQLLNVIAGCARTLRVSVVSGLRYGFPYCVLILQSVVVVIVFLAAIFLLKTGNFVASVLLAAWILINTIVVIDWLPRPSRRGCRQR